MWKYGAGLALAILVACSGLPRASHAQAMGEVRVAFAKAGLIAGAGAGRGVLTYRGHDYPFRVRGLSLGVTIGASAMRLTGTVTGLREVQRLCRHIRRRWRRRRLGRWPGRRAIDQSKGRQHHALGIWAGMEFAANRSGIRISLQ